VQAKIGKAAIGTRDAQQRQRDAQQTDLKRVAYEGACYRQVLQQQHCCRQRHGGQAG
jgi:hypothetical protein